jgi:hypothetical protein
MDEVEFVDIHALNACNSHESAAGRSSIPRKLFVYML